jgi:hypothetical protein
MFIGLDYVKKKNWFQSVPLNKKITIHHLTKHCLLE